MSKIVKIFFLKFVNILWARHGLMVGQIRTRTFSWQVISSLQGKLGQTPSIPVEHYLVVFMNLKTRFKVYKVSISYLIQIIFFYFPDENSQIIFFYFFRLGSPIFLPVDTEHNIRELVYSAEQSYNLTAWSKFLIH